MKLLVTGGAGFIGSAFVRLSLAAGNPDTIINLDKLTYAGNLENLESVAGHPQYGSCAAIFATPGWSMRFWPKKRRMRLCILRRNRTWTEASLRRRRSSKPTCEARLHCSKPPGSIESARFVHVSTDEVYGSLEAPLEADEKYPLNPSSPYSAAKAGSDLLARSYFTTYRMPVVITRASNNYGPYQFPEKLIPLMISNALESKSLPVYGDGMQVRDWLYVEDHCRAIRAVLEKGREGEIYNIGGSRSLPNLEVIHKILAATGKPETLTTHGGGSSRPRSALCAVERKTDA